jgi:hypothetical protein
MSDHSTNNHNGTRVMQHRARSGSVKFKLTVPKPADTQLIGDNYSNALLKEWKQKVRTMLDGICPDVGIIGDDNQVEGALFVLDSLSYSHLPYYQAISKAVPLKLGTRWRVAVENREETHYKDTLVLHVAAESERPGLRPIFTRILPISAVVVLALYLFYCWFIL